MGSRLRSVAGAWGLSIGTRLSLPGNRSGGDASNFFASAVDNKTETANTRICHATAQNLPSTARQPALAGRVRSARQVLNARDFARIEPGKWTRDDVLREFGRPAMVDRVASWQGDILTYRWYDLQDLFYWVYLDGNQVVQRAHPGMEFRNDKDPRN